MDSCLLQLFDWPGYSPAMIFSGLHYRISHTRFCLVFCAATYAVCNALNLDKLSRWFRTGDSLDVLALVAYLLAGLCLFVAVFTLVAHRWTLKAFAILLILASATATYF